VAAGLPFDRQRERRDLPAGVCASSADVVAASYDPVLVGLVGRDVRRGDVRGDTRLVAVDRDDVAGDQVLGRAQLRQVGLPVPHEVLRRDVLRLAPVERGVVHVDCVAAQRLERRPVARVDQQPEVRRQLGELVAVGHVVTCRSSQATAWAAASLT
jgi:hypothetical protein